jgi:uncharacterized protein
LADRFVKDPHEVVKAGDVVKVTVTEVDVPRKRIGLTMRKDGGASAKEDRNARSDFGAKGRGGAGGGQRDKGPRGSGSGQHSAKPKQDSNGALGAALMDAMRKK